jgi:hypothetical protein
MAEEILSAATDGRAIREPSGKSGQTTLWRRKFELLLSDGRNARICGYYYYPLFALVFLVQTCAACVLGLCTCRKWPCSGPKLADARKAAVERNEANADKHGWHKIALSRDAGPD